MGVTNKAALALTQCWTCFGCNRLEDERFRGDNTCKNYRRATANKNATRTHAGEAG